MAAKRGARRSKAKRTRPSRPRTSDGELRGVVEQLALLTSVNNLMAQTAFLTVERLRISSEVVDETISQEFGNELFQACERLVEQSDAVVLGLLDGLALEGERADHVRALIGMRRQFKDRARKPMEQRRLVESLERMYR